MTSIKVLVSDILKKESRRQTRMTCRALCECHLPVPARRISFARLPGRQPTGGMLAAQYFPSGKEHLLRRFPIWGKSEVGRASRRRHTWTCFDAYVPLYVLYACAGCRCRCRCRRRSRCEQSHVAERAPAPAGLTPSGCWLHLLRPNHLQHQAIRRRRSL